MRDFFDNVLRDPFFVLFGSFLITVMILLFYLLVDVVDFAKASNLCRMHCAEKHSTSRYETLRQGNGMVKCACLEKANVLIIKRD